MRVMPIFATVAVGFMSGCRQTPVAMPPLEEPYEPSATSSVHIVEQGEDLRSVAARWAVPTSLIQTVNGITGTSLTVGQRLAIPPEPPPSTNTMMESNDIIWCGEEK